MFKKFFQYPEKTKLALMLLIPLTSGIWAVTETYWGKAEQKIENLAEACVQFASEWIIPFNQITEIYQRINIVFAEAESSRVGLIRARTITNRKNEITKANSSILTEIFQHRKGWYRPLWQSRPMDKVSMSYLSKLTKNDELWLKTSELEDGLLKTVFEAHDIKQAYYQMVLSSADTKNHVYLLSVWEEERDLTPKEKEAIIYAVTDIKYFIKQSAILSFVLLGEELDE